MSERVWDPAKVGLVACDLDRTLTDTRLRLVPSALAAMGQVRRAGIPTVLVTGRTLPEVRHQPAVLACFDWLVLEGGGLVGTPDRVRPIVRGRGPLRELSQWLEAHGITHRLGATSLSIARGGLRTLQRYPHIAAFQPVANRDRIDVTAAGIHKGSGLARITRARRGHGTILAFGDGENDVPLLRAADYGVAVRNAKAMLKREADEITRYDGGRGVADFLVRRVLPRLHP